MAPTQKSRLPPPCEVGGNRPTYRRSGPMVAQQTATRARKPTKAARKPAYRPRITFLSATEYLVPSERFAGHIIYKVSVLPSGRAQCECRAADLGKACKHRRLALAAHAYRLAPTHLRPATGEVAAVAPGSGLGVRVASTGKGYEVYSLRTGALICHVNDPAVAGLPTARQAQGVDWTTLAAQFAAVAVPSFDFRAQAAPAPAFIPAPPAFSELFAA